ncbi:iron chelate uptake ABC transporter family permease subunit [Iamia sp. SCSIO 61187]|nr:iron chelate uptake ABC transporter family permease subunit [Iamia sp. SCSIO 61187]
MVARDPEAPAAVRPPRRGLLRGGWSRSLGLAVALAVLVLAVGCSLALGARPVPFGRVWDALVAARPTDPDAARDWSVVRSLRGPRTILGLLVGAALGMTGTLIQGLTRNPLADPGILGVQAGASLAVVVGINTVSIEGAMGYVWFGFAGAAVAGAVVYALGSLGRGGASPVKLALAGAAMSALLLALTQAVLLSNQATLNEYRFWAVGSLAGRESDVVRAVAPFIVVGILFGLSRGRSLNGLALGDDLARGLGLSLVWARISTALAIIVLCGAAVAGAGPIVFVGLVIPHVARSICGPDYRWILAWSLVLAPTLLLGADTLGRLIARPGEVQVGIMTAVIGTPGFIAIIRRKDLAGL